MNFLRRELAPISPQGWSEIDYVAKKALAANLSARKFVDVDGPHGLDHASVPLGRLAMPKGQDKAAVRYGIHQVLPLVEVRADFSLLIWELDNIERGAKDIDLDAVVKGSREIAAFEEKAIYEGFAPGAIVGLQQAVKSKKIKISLDAERRCLGGCQFGGFAAFMGVSSPLCPRGNAPFHHRKRDRWPRHPRRVVEGRAAYLQPRRRCGIDCGARFRDRLPWPHGG
jgi:hypothetical protein